MAPILSLRKFVTPVALTIQAFGRVHWSLANNPRGTSEFMPSRGQIRLCDLENIPKIKRDAVSAM